MFSKLIGAAWMTGYRLDELVYATHSRLDHTIIGKGNKLPVIDLADWGFERIFAWPPVKLCKPWLFWHHTGEPYKTASGRFMAPVKSYARSAQKQESIDFTICGMDMLSTGSNQGDPSMTYGRVWVTLA